MHDTKLVFSPNHVQKVAEEMKAVSQTYEALFSDLGEQILRDIDPLTVHSDQIETTLNHIETALEAFSQYFPTNNSVACKKGCGHCCVYPVKTPIQMISFIAKHLESSLNEEQMAQLKNKMRINIEQRQPPLYRATCPFLSEENACTIYEHRPLACRLFTSPNVQLCLKSISDGSNVSQQPIRYRIYEAATVALQADQKKQDKPYEQVDFIPALLAELTDPNE
jgi:Fe-S-cluster containining protein